MVISSPFQRRFCGRVHLLGFSALGALAMLSACGGGSGPIASTPAPAPSPSPTPAPVPTPAPSPSPTPAPTSSFDTAEYRRSDGPSQHGAITAWQAGFTGTGQTIAIVDTGIDQTNTEFAGRILATSRDVTGNGRSIQAVDEHGTDVALVAAAARNNSGIMGIAFNASLLVLRADDPGSCTQTTPDSTEGTCRFVDSDIAKGVDAAVAGGARVINISLGGNDGISAALRDAVARASSAGVVVVVASGNGGDGSDPGADPAQPTSFASQLRAAGGSNVIIVGSVDAGNQMSSFSQRAGSEAAWYLDARGEAICCAYQNSQIYVGHDASGSYNLLFSGTSFATPQVAGAVALLAQAFPNLTGQQIVRLLLDSARDLGAAGIDPVYGAGLLDIAAAMQPRGTLTLAGGANTVAPGSDAIAASPAMGDAMGSAGGVAGIVLDEYQRAYQIDFSGGLHGSGLPDRLHAALAGGVRTTSAAAGGVALAFTIADPLTSPQGQWASELRLTPEQARGAEVLAARVMMRIAPGTQMALAMREGASGLGAQLRGARQPAFLIARPAGEDEGFARRSDMAFALRRQVGAFGVTVSADSGVQQPADWRRARYALDLGARDGDRVRSFGMALDRRFGQLATNLGVTWLGEDSTVLGARFAPVFGVQGADTLFLDAVAGWDFAGAWHVGAAWRQGWTRARSGGLVAPGSQFVTNGWSADLTRTGLFARGDSLGLRVSQPLRVATGGIGLTLPVSYDYATLTPGYAERFLSLAPTGREVDGELAWRGPLWGGEGGVSLFYRTDPGHYAAIRDDAGAAASWRFTF